MRVWPGQLWLYIVFSEFVKAVNLSGLETAHSIFARWRSETRSNELFKVINFVLAQLAEPFLQVFCYTAGMLIDNPLPAKKDAETVTQVSF